MNRIILRDADQREAKGQRDPVHRSKQRADSCEPANPALASGKALNTTLPMRR